MMAPIEALHGLEEGVLINESNLTLEAANAALANVKEDMLYIRMEVDVRQAKSFGIDLLKGGKWDATTYTYDVENALIQGRTENKGEGEGQDSDSLFHVVMISFYFVLFGVTALALTPGSRPSFPLRALMVSMGASRTRQITFTPLS
jgi:hypothetical protein